MDIFSIFDISITILLGILIIVLYQKSRQLSINLNLILFSLVLIEAGNICALIPFWFFKALQWPLITVGFIGLYFHYARINSSSPNLGLIILVFMLFAYSYGIHFVMVYYLNVEALGSDIIYSFTDLDAISSYYARILFVSSNYASGLCNVFIFTYSLMVTLRINRRVGTSYTRWDLFAQICLSIYAWLMFFRYFFPAYLEPLTLIGIIAVSTGIVVWSLLFYRYPDYTYLLPFPIHSFMLYNRAGLLCYSKKLAPTEDVDDNLDVLITGAFTAISALIKETLGQGATIQHINAEQFQIYFQPLRQDSTLVVIAYGDSGYFPLSLARVDPFMDGALIKDLNRPGLINTDLEERIDALLKQAFPYAEFETTSL